MKRKTIFLILVIFCAGLCFGQNLNERRMYTISYFFDMYEILDPLQFEVICFDPLPQVGLMVIITERGTIPFVNANWLNNVWRFYVLQDYNPDKDVYEKVLINGSDAGDISAGHLRIEGDNLQFIIEGWPDTYVSFEAVKITGELVKL